MADNIDNSNNGDKDNKSKEFVVLSKVRAGHKREFEFAIRAQNEISGLLGRTRARRAPAGPTGSPDVLEGSRMKKRVKRKEEKVVAVEESEDELKSDVVDVFSDDESNRCQLVESRRRRENVANIADANANANAFANANEGEGESESDPVVDNEDGDDNVLNKDKDKKKKVPAKLKELLETGLLEGLSVKYIRGRVNQIFVDGLLFDVVISI